METRATVIAVEPGFAWVESRRRSSCSHCGTQDSCGVAALDRAFGAGRNRMRLADPLGVCAGEAVIIGLSERHLVAAAALAYLLPLLTMIAGGLLAAQLGYGQIGSVVLSVAGLAVGLWLVHRRGRSAAGGGLYAPTLLRRAAGDDIHIPFESVKRSQP